MDNLEVEWVPVGDLFENPANPRRNDDAVPHVAASLRRFGWQQPLVVKASGEVVAGHTRLKAAGSLGMERVPVVRFEGNELDAAAFGIADNRTHEHSSWDEKALGAILEALREEDGLDGVGFTAEEVQELISALHMPEDGEIEDAGPPELQEEAVSQAGDLWVLGEHRLVCGDSTDSASYGVLLKGEGVDLVWTDPPYGVRYEGKTSDALTIENDGLEGDELGAFLAAALGQVHAVTKPGAVWYVAAPAGPNFLPFAQVLTELGVWRQTLVWVKDSLVLGRSDFHYRHEALFYGWTPGAAHQAPPSRTHDTVWEIPRPKASREHPTMKPPALVARGLELSSKPGGLVLDPFCGSGTTLVACEATGRRGRGIELDPRYCDAAVRRWEATTGKNAVLEGDGRVFVDVATERALAPAGVGEGDDG